MNLTKKHRYGLSAMVQLAFYAQKNPIQLRIISEKASIPHSFLEQLILDLKKHGLVNSVRGSKGGYQLNRLVSDISVRDIFDAIDPITCTAATSDSLSFFWQKFDDHINDFLNLNLQSIIEDLLNKKKVLTYSI